MADQINHRSLPPSIPTSMQEANELIRQLESDNRKLRRMPVSYTHLTLTTNLEV